MKKILITGGSGFFGSRFFQYYKDKYNILSLSSKDLDITDEQHTLHTVQTFQPDYVLHTAAIADTGVCENNPEKTHDINVKGTVNIAKGCALTNAKLLYCSSEQVYNGNCEPGPYSEEDTPVPNTVYGRQKLAAEEEIKKILDEVWILRLTWLFGFPEKNCRINRNMLMNMLSSIMCNQPVSEPTHEYRGMTYVYDIIENIEKMFEIPYGIYNVGSENNFNRYEIACHIFKLLGTEHKINELVIPDIEKFKTHPRDLRISNHKLRDHGIYFNETKEAFEKSIQDFGFNDIHPIK